MMTSALATSSGGGGGGGRGDADCDDGDDDDRPPPLFATLSTQTIASTATGGGGGGAAAAAVVRPITRRPSQSYVLTLHIDRQPQSPVPTFLPGETITGKIAVTVKSATALRTLTVRLLGQISPGPERLKYTSNMTIFNITRNVAAADSDEPTTVLQPGLNTFTFSITIPAAVVPASFESSYGRVRYTVSAHVTSRSGLVDMGSVHRIKIPCILDVNGTRFLVPTSREASFHVSRRGWSRLSDVIASAKSHNLLQQRVLNATLSLDRRGFRAGEVIHASVAIHNPAALAVTLDAMQVIEMVDYRIGPTASRTPLATHDLTIMSSPPPSTTTAATETWTLTIQLPTSLRPTLVSPLLSVSHSLSITLSLRDTHPHANHRDANHSLTVSVPFIIGARASTIASISAIRRHRSGSVDTLPSYGASFAIPTPISSTPSSPSGDCNGGDALSPQTTICDENIADDDADDYLDDPGLVLSLDRESRH